MKKQINASLIYIRNLIAKGLFIRLIRPTSTKLARRYTHRSLLTLMVTLSLPTQRSGTTTINDVSSVMGYYWLGDPSMSWRSCWGSLCGTQVQLRSRHMACSAKPRVTCQGLPRTYDVIRDIVILLSGENEVSLRLKRQLAESSI
jgi:hypothetical protein